MNADSERRLKVALVRPTGRKGGGMWRVADYMQATLGDGARGAAFEAFDIRGTGALATTPIVFLSEARRLRRLARAGAVDLVHLFAGDRLSLVRKCAFARVARSCKLPYLMHLHAAELAPFLDRVPNAGIGWLRQAFIDATAIAVLGQSAATMLASRFDLAPSSIRIVPNGVEAPERTDFDRPRDGKTVLFVGNLHPRKGIDDLLRAFARPEITLHSARLVLAGGGDIDRYRREAVALGIAEQVVFQGWRSRDQVSTSLLEASVLVLPSHAEALPLSVLEALGHGVPVITTDVGETSQYLTAGQDVIFTPQNDPAMLAVNISDVLSNQTLAQALARNGRLAWERHFGIDRYLDTILDVYDRCLIDTATRQESASAAIEGNAHVRTRAR